MAMIRIPRNLPALAAVALADGAIRSRQTLREAAKKGLDSGAREIAA